jgi:cell division protein FtsI/penicillin-binding protein 2
MEALGIEGVYFVEESMRVYPNRELACHALGFVNMNGDGTYGMEQQYDKDLKGKEGLFSLDVDARRRSYRAQVDKPPVQGRSLVLSIDKSIQYIADRELITAVEKVMPSRNRQSHRYRQNSQTSVTNIITHAADFTNARLDMQPGRFWLGGARWRAGLTPPNERLPLGSIAIGNAPTTRRALSFSQILELSSNVGAANRFAFGEQRLYESLRNFGSGPVRIDLPGDCCWCDWQLVRFRSSNLLVRGRGHSYRS